MVAIGLISYPLYLWHWPLLTFVRLTCTKEAPLYLILAAVLASFALAWATWRFIEVPVRRRHQARTSFLAAGMVALAAAGAACMAGIIQPWSAAFGLEKVFAGRDDPQFPVGLVGLEFHGLAFAVVGEGPHTTLFIGDSTMQENFLRIQARIQALPAGTRRAVMATGHSCVAIPGVSVEGDGRWCVKSMQAAFAYAMDPAVDRVVIGCNWHMYFFNDKKGVRYFFDGGGRHYALGVDTEGARKARMALGQTIAALVARHKDVTVILDTPYGEDVAPQSVVQRSPWSGFKVSQGFADRRDLAATLAPISLPLKDLALQNGAAVVDPFDTLCNGNVCPALTPDGYPIYMDVIHLRTTYVRDHVDYLDASLAP